MLVRGRKRKVIVGGVTVLVVFSAGRCSVIGTNDPPHDSERSGHGKPVVVVSTSTVVKSVVKYRATPECITALDDLDKIITAASGIANVGTPELDLLSNAHEAITSHDYSRLVQLQEDQMAINDKTVGYVKDLYVGWLPQLNELARQCRRTK